MRLRRLFAGEFVRHEDDGFHVHPESGSVAWGVSQVFRECACVCLRACVFRECDFVCMFARVCETPALSHPLASHPLLPSLWRLRWLRGFRERDGYGPARPCAVCFRVHVGQHCFAD